MDVSKILEELRQEREQLEEAILSLERLSLRARQASWAVPPPGWWKRKSVAGLRPGSKNRTPTRKRQLRPRRKKVQGPRWRFS